MVRGDEMSELVLTCHKRGLLRELNIIGSQLIITLVNGKKEEVTCTIDGREMRPRLVALDEENYDKVTNWLKKLGKA